jgi:hypothetical protein
MWSFGGPGRSGDLAFGQQQEGCDIMAAPDESRTPERRSGTDRRVNLTDRRKYNLGGNPYDPNFTDRRSGRDRRQSVVDRRLGLDRQRGPGRRRSDERKSAEEGQMSDEQFEFIMAIDEYKRANARPFPTWTEVLEIIKALGYRRVAEPQALARHGSLDDSAAPPTEEPIPPAPAQVAE